MRLNGALRIAGLSAVVLLGGILYLFVDAKGDRLDACGSTNELRVVLRGIVKATEPRLRTLRREGTLTQAQLDRALKDSKTNRRKLRNKDCD